jgi:TP901 family phage tail tape measure protein
MAKKKLRDEDLVLNIIVNGDQGRKEILDLEKAIKQTNRELRQLERQREELIKTGKKETAEYKAVTAAIDLKNSALDKARGRLAQLRQGMDLNSKSVSDLRREITRLTKLRNIAPPMTEEWHRHNEQLRLVQARYNELTGRAQGLGKMFSGGLAKGIGVAAAAVTSFVIAGRQVMRVVDDFGRFDDLLADVRKTTNLTFGELENLNDEIKSIDTRSSQEELLKLARTAGKLGIEGSENVLGFVRAADQIGVALAEDLGGDVEQALRQVGKLVDIFNVREEFGIEQGMLKVGSVINELGINSTAAEQYMVDFTKRLAGVAPAAKISIANVMGYSSTLDQLGQSAEVAGTTFVNLIPDLFTNPSKFAKIAGIEAQEFSRILNEDANEALIKLFEGIKGNESSMTAMAQRLVQLGLDGARATNVVSALANNTELLRSEQEIANKAFREGISLTNEFNIKNETLAANVEKIGRYFYNLYMNSELRAGMRDFFGGIADWLYTSNQALKSFQEQDQAVQALEANVSPLIARYEELETKTNRSAAENEELKTVINQIGAAIPGAITQFDGYGNAIGISTGKAKEFIEAQRLMLKYMNREAIEDTKEGLIDTKEQIVDILQQLNRRDADGDLAKLVSRQYGFQMITEEVKLTAEEIANLQANLAALRKQEKDQETLIKGLSGEIDPNEGSTSGTTTTPPPTPEPKTETEEERKAREAREKAAAAERERAIKAAQKQAEQEAELRRKYIIGQLDLVAQEKIAYEERLKAAGLYYLRKDEMSTEQLLAYEAMEDEHLQKLNDITSKRLDENLQTREDQYKADLQALKTLHNEEYKSFETMEQIKSFLRDKVSRETLDGITNMRQAQIALDKHYLAEEEELTRQYLNGLLQDLQILASTGQLEGVDLANQILSPEQKAELEARIAQIKLMLSELGLGSGTEIEADRGERRRDVDVLGFSVDDWQTFFDNLDKGKVGFNEMLMGVQALQGVYATYAAYVSAGERKQLQEYESANRKKQDILKKQLDAGIINQDQYNNQIEKLNADLDKKKAVFDRNEAKRERNIALMTAIVQGAAAVNSALKLGPVFAAIVGALAAVQVGTILKTPLPEIPGAEDGGFLRDVVRAQDKKMYRAKMDPGKRGYVDRPTVLVGEGNKREFVASNEAVENPTIGPVLDAIDTAQRQGRISSLNLFKVLDQNKQLMVMPGRQRGGRISDQSAAGRSTADALLPDMMDLLRKNERTMAQLNARLSKPIKSDVSLTGRGSLEEKQDELQVIEQSANL